MKDLEDLDIELIQQAIENGDTPVARREINELHPADIAELFGELNLRQAEWLFNLIDGNEKKADVLMELDEEDRKRLLEGYDPEEIGHFIDLLDTDDAVDLIQELDKEDRDEVIAHIDDMEQAGNIVDLLQYDEDTAGGLMGTEMIVVNENLSMPECIKEMRAQAEEMDDVFNIYVVDDDQRLTGILPLKKMITDPSVSKIKRVMDVDPRSVMDEVREQSERDYQLASGLSSDVDADDSVFSQTKARIPWLLIGIVSGIFASLILAGFQEQIAAVTALALFIPIIGGTGGNVGVQASAIVVQGLANGSLEIKEFGKQIGKEMLIGLTNAVIIATVILIYNLIMMPHDLAVTLSVAISLFVVVMFATLLGTLVPLTLEKLHINPALATGPFIQISNDIVGLVIYVYISKICLELLGSGASI